MTGAHQAYDPPGSPVTLVRGRAGRSSEAVDGSCRPSCAPSRHTRSQQWGSSANRHVGSGGAGRSSFGMTSGGGAGRCGPVPWSLPWFEGRLLRSRAGSWLGRRTDGAGGTVRDGPPSEVEAFARAPTMTTSAGTSWSARPIPRRVRIRGRVGSGLRSMTDSPRGADAPNRCPPPTASRARGSFRHRPPPSDRRRSRGWAAACRVRCSLTCPGAAEWSRSNGMAQSFGNLFPA